MRRKSKRQALTNAKKRAFNATAAKFNGNLQDVLRSPRRWDGFEGRVTKRKNGETVTGSYRNIEDLGNLANSQEFTVDESKCTAYYSWDGNGVTPAQNVYFGVRTSNDFIPGRMWDKKALEESDLGQEFKSNFK